MTVGPSLTAEQRTAVEAPDGPYLVVAAPGSGKTEVLVRRVLWVVEQSAREPFRVLALTYTNKAAEELRQRARTTLGDESRRVTATTLHSFCLDMLQRYGEAVGILGEVSMYDSDDLRLDTLEQALLAAGYEVTHYARDQELAALLEAIDRSRSGLIPPELAADEGWLDGEVSLSEAYRLYEEALDNAQALDFPGMLYRGYRLLTEDPWVGSITAGNIATSFSTRLRT